jgi:ketosteroid isomerase-like protein
MKLAPLIAIVAFLAGGASGWLVRGAAVAPASRNLPAEAAGPATPSAADLKGIEKLHREDVSATLSGDPAELAKLWTGDAVRLEPGGPAEVGKKAITADDVKETKDHPEGRIVSYTPHIENLEIVDGWAFEWDYFDASFRESPRGKPQSFRAKALRVLRRQSDGSWKFSRVMWNLAQP